MFRSFLSYPIKGFPTASTVQHSKGGTPETFGRKSHGEVRTKRKYRILPIVIGLCSESTPLPNIPVKRDENAHSRNRFPRSRHPPGEYRKTIGWEEAMNFSPTRLLIMFGGSAFMCRSRKAPTTWEMRTESFSVGKIGSALPGREE
jgi:hypothetical protein